MPAQGPYFLSGIYVPELDHSVRSARGKPAAFGAEGNAQHRAPVTRQNT
jgi:hypothetical protein